MALELPALPYAYDALGPYMSKETLEYHHDKHHMAYVTNGNNLLKDSPLASKSIEEICKTAYAEKIAGLVNNVGQHYNHIHFWNWMKPNGGGKKLPGKLEKLVTEYGGYDKLRTDFVQAGVTQFGSGWCWLVKDVSGALKVTKTENGVNPLCFGQTALLGCDVWEHSYYIDFRNKRPAYLSNFVEKLVNWEAVAARM